jgi:hypothetical protein
MKVSINGLRSSLSGDCIQLKREIDYINNQLVGTTLTKDDIFDLKEKFDEVARSVGMLNLVYDDEVEGDFDDLSGQIKIPRFEQEEDDETS